MSCARYTLILKVGDMTYSRKLKTKLGDYEGFRKEINLAGDWEQMARGMTETYGGLEEMQKRWQESIKKESDEEQQ